MPERSSGPDLEQRLRVLELEVTELRRPRRSRAPSIHRSRTRRVLAAISLVVTLGVLPMVAVASDTFGDVATGSQFHAAINNVYDARITRGCDDSPLLFCPGDTVNRQQMAGFLNRGLGRATGSSSSINLSADSGGSEVVSVSLTPGGLTGGTAFVVVTGSVTAFTFNGTTCPCEVGMRVQNVTASDEPTLWQFFDVSNTATPTGYRNASGSMSWVFEVPSGTTQEFAVMVNVDMAGAPGDLDLQGHITALYVPFGGTGGSTLSTFDASGSAGRGD